MKYTRDELEHFIETIDEHGLNLSKWEAEFVASVAAQLAERGTLSERQIEILDRIYTERTP